METKDIVEFLKENFDSSYHYTVRYCFIEINTHQLCENGFPITVFLTNNLPNCIIVSDSGWLMNNKYDDFSLLIPVARKVHENRWGVVPYFDETLSLYHTITCYQINDVVEAVNAMRNFIMELGVSMEVRRLNI